MRQLTKLWESGQQAAVICTEVDNVEEGTDCDNLDITTEPLINTGDLEAEANVIEEVQSVEVCIDMYKPCGFIFTCVYSYILDK